MDEIAQRADDPFDAETIQFRICRSLSTEKGSNEHHPWLLTVFQKEKSAGVEIVIDVIMGKETLIPAFNGQYKERSKQRQNAIFKISS